MKDAQLQKMSAQQLVALRDRIDAILPAKQQDERKVVRDKLEELAQKHGFKASDLFGRGGKGSKVAPKYRNPKNPSETWTGRGRKPRWIVAAGGDAKRFLIK
jgi:DNA-binding protein H-NS